MIGKLKALLIAGARDVFGARVVRDHLDRAPIRLSMGQIAGGLPAKMGSGLVVQGVDPDGNFLASRGFKIYRSNPSNDRFEFYCQLPCPIGSGQLLRFPSLREAIGKRDIVQAFFTASGAMIVQSGGALYRRAPGSSSFDKVFSLRHWGRAGRGILFHGIAQSSHGRLFVGEYFNNEQRENSICIFASDDDGATWFVLHEFPPGRFRHIHAIQQDPFEDALWMCTGDSDDESQLLKSTDNGKTFEVVGTGSQSWRTCTLLFEQDYVYWGADTERGVDCRNLYQYHRADKRLDKLDPIDGAIEFAIALHPELQLYATTRVGYGETPDPEASLLLKKTGADLVRIKLNSRINSTVGVPSGTKMYRSESSGDVCLSFTNLVGLDGKIAIVSSDTFQNRVNNRTTS